MDENTYFIDKDDEAELARLLVQDNAYNLALNLLPTGYVFQPEMRILDLACGPGGWVLQVSYDHPELSVIGVDLSPQMITYARAQAEVRELSAQFRIMDLLRVPWPFPDQHFDLLNARFITSLTPKAFLPTLYQECWRVLRPGGALRYTEGSFVSTPTSAATQKLSLLSCVLKVNYFCPQMAITLAESSFLDSSRKLSKENETAMPSGRHLTDGHQNVNYPPIRIASPKILL